MATIQCSVTISALDSNDLSETVEAQVDAWSSYAVFPENLLRRLEIKPERQHEFERRDGSRVVKWIGYARVTIEGQAGPATVVFGDTDEPPRVSKITLAGVRLRVDPEHNRLVYEMPRMKPPGWYEEQRLLREWVEGIEVGRGNAANQGREEQ